MDKPLAREVERSSVCQRSQSMKVQYDKHAKHREFARTLVLVRTPDLEGKLSDIWD